jgi:nicotinamidase-related amidase
MKPALLVIDTQKAYLPMMDPRGQDMVMYLIKTVIEVFHQFKFPVVAIHHTDPKRGPKPEDPDFAFPESLGILPEDTRVVKTHSNGFRQTDLHEQLQALGCDTLFLCGLSAVACVLATYFGADSYDYHSFLLKNMLLSHNADYTNTIENAFGAIDIDTLVWMLKNGKWDGK